MKFKCFSSFEPKSSFHYFKGQNLIGGYNPSGRKSVPVAAIKPLNLNESAYLVRDPSTPCGKWMKVNSCCPCIQCDELDGSACGCWKLDCISNFKAEELWPIFKVKYNKNYSQCEDQRRFQIFKQTVEEAAKKENKFTVTELADVPSLSM